MNVKTFAKRSENVLYKTTICDRRRRRRKRQFLSSKAKLEAFLFISQGDETAVDGALRQIGANNKDHRNLMANGW